MRVRVRGRGAQPPLVRVGSLLFGLLLLSLPAGCGYRLAGLGAGLPGHIEVVAILPFENESAFPEVEEGMTEEIIEGFNRRRPLHRPGNGRGSPGGDGGNRVECGLLAGTAWIRRPGRPQPISSSSRARVEFTDVVNDVALFESDEFTLRDEFSIGDDPDAAFDREGLAFSRIASAFADSLLVAILEGF